MLLPDDLSPESFLSAYWQKAPLRMPQALAAVRPALTAGELAWLATQEDVEARLIFSHEDGNGTRYEVRHGPFENDVLSSLPRRDWTLLVQDVEKHLPDFRALFTAVDFIPDWRIDDLMVSFAAPGGNVGPHVDNYDVFLCQGEGSREWHLGDPAAVVADDTSSELRLVQPFIDRAPQACASGDVLYLPPGAPHWGIARDFCMTYSIGMRAPNRAELSAGVARLEDAPDEIGARSSAAGADSYYEDPDLSLDEAVPGLISAAAIRRATGMLAAGAALDDRQVALALGSVATDPKAWLEPEAVAACDFDRTRRWIATCPDLNVHGMTKLAYCEAGRETLLFANGHALAVGGAAGQIFRAICKFRTISSREICANAAPGFLEWLLASAVFDLTGRPA